MTSKDLAPVSIRVSWLRRQGVHKSVSAPGERAAAALNAAPRANSAVYGEVEKPPSGAG